MEPVNWLDDCWSCCPPVVVKCLLLVGRYQLAGASLAGKESCPQTSTMSDAEPRRRAAGAGTTRRVPATIGVVTSRLLRLVASLVQPSRLVGLIQPNGEASLTTWSARSARNRRLTRPSALERAVPMLVRWFTRSDVKRSMLANVEPSLSWTDAWLLGRITDTGPVRLSELADLAGGRPVHDDHRGPTAREAGTGRRGPPTRGRSGGPGERHPGGRRAAPADEVRRHGRSTSPCSRTGRRRTSPPRSGSLGDSPPPWSPDRQVGRFEDEVVAGVRVRGALARTTCSATSRWRRVRARPGWLVRRGGRSDVVELGSFGRGWLRVVAKARPAISRAAR